jgi:hypothetical protein
MANFIVLRNYKLTVNLLTCHMIYFTSYLAMVTFLFQIFNACVLQKSRRARDKDFLSSSHISTVDILMSVGFEGCVLSQHWRGNIRVLNIRTSFYLDP